LRRNSHGAFATGTIGRRDRYCLERANSTAHQYQGRNMLGTILIILLILALVGAFPRWPYSAGWGYGPSGIVGVLLIVVLILALSGRV
jgi:hypothetical protein